jgi:hypothetical protein
MPIPTDSVKTSPIKVNPLRMAGQSLDEKINDLIADRSVLHAMIMALALVLAGSEWLRWFTQAEAVHRRRGRSHRVQWGVHRATSPGASIPTTRPEGGEGGGRTPR